MKLIAIVAGSVALFGTLPLSSSAARETLKASETIPFETEAKDGVVLRGHVTLPYARGPFATILELSPYFNTGLGGTTANGPSSSAQQEYLEAGFAIAQVNMRGTGLSEGCLQFGNKIDQGDAYVVVEALADEKWSNGNIGMIGTSYPAWSQYMAIATDPPSLKAVVPASGVSDPYELLTRIGAPTIGGPPFAPIWTAITGWASTGNNREHICGNLYADHWQGAFDLTATGDKTKYWAERNLRPLLKDTDIPVWRANGLNYWAEGHWQSYEREWQLLNPVRTRMLLGQWNHEHPSCCRGDWHSATIAWFDHYLRGGPRTIKPGVVEFQDTAQEWHTADSWPPSADNVTLHLSRMSLVDEKSVEDSSQVFETAAGIEPGLSCGPHQVFYVSAPLKEDVVLAGYFDVDLTVTSSLPGGNLVTTLRHLPSDFPCNPDISDVFSMTGVDEYESAVGRMQMDLRHWKTHGKHRDFPVGQATRVTERSGPFAAFVPKGHRLVLFVAGGSMELEPDPFQPVISITTGKGLAGSIQIPVFEGNLRFVE